MWSASILFGFSTRQVREKIVLSRRRSSRFYRQIGQGLVGATLLFSAVFELTACSHEVGKFGPPLGGEDARNLFAGYCADLPGEGSRCWARDESMLLVRFDEAEFLEQRRRMLEERAGASSASERPPVAYFIMGAFSSQDLQYFGMDPSRVSTAEPSTRIVCEHACLVVIPSRWKFLGVHRGYELFPSSEDFSVRQLLDRLNPNVQAIVSLLGRSKQVVSVTLVDDRSQVTYCFMGSALPESAMLGLKACEAALDGVYCDRRCLSNSFDELALGQYIRIGD